jgi:hexosaminidase
MEGILQKFGKKLIGWDEILEGGLSPNATVMSWRGEQGGIKAASAGHHVVMTPSHEGMYLDHYQGDPKIEPVAIGNYTTLEKVYNYDPVPKELADNGHADMVQGVQCNNWSEYIYTPSHREYMLYPRAFALAEIAWAKPEGKDFKAFCRRVDAACQRLDKAGVNYHIPLPEQPEGSCNELALIDKAEVAFTTTRLMEMVWTLDGTEPTADSRRYMFPFTFTEDAVLKIATLTPYGKLSPVRTIHIRKQQPLPAVEPAFGGIRARRAEGRFVTAADLAGASWREISVSGLRDLGKQELRDRNLPDSTRFYGAVAEGYFKVSHTDVYRFSSDCDQVWIDGKLLIDNGAEVKKYSRHDTELALCKGVHAVKIVFLYNVGGGWNTIQNKTDVQIRRTGLSEWKSLKILP